MQTIRGLTRTRIHSLLKNPRKVIRLNVAKKIIITIERELVESLNMLKAGKLDMRRVNLSGASV